MSHARVRPDTVTVARRTRSGLAIALAGVLSLSLAACTGSESEAPEGDSSPVAGSSGPVEVTADLGKRPKAVPVDHVVRVEAEGGTLRSVAVSGGGDEVSGTLSEDGSSWTATELLEPGTQYVARTVAESGDGSTERSRSRFRTVDLTLDEQTYPSVAPLAGEEVGVGMPVIVSFDVAVSDKASIEKHLSVTSSPQQAGAWHWISDNEVHWRPKAYWKPGTEVTVDADVNSVSAGNGIYGQESRRVAFTVGDSVVHKIDVARHQMRTLINGKLARTIPISAGKAGFETRSGTKVIIEKHRSKRMDAATTGISESDPEYYNIANVEYALRVTYSGEFLHAAPWSAGSQGAANVSHGCVGMSTSDAAWVYGMTRRGDVVEVTGTERQMTLENGYGDWNLPFNEYKQGSALS
ncbi:L,D-transpeptidase [Nocardioides pacificus]